MVSMRVGSRLLQMPTRSRMSRLACDSAMGRTESFEEDEFPAGKSKSRRLRPDPLRASASVQPTGPAPRMSTSTAAAGISHQRFYVVDRLGRLGGEDLAPG